jgi:hypothetical protein
MHFLASNRELIVGRIVFKRQQAGCEGAQVQSPLSRDEHAAMARYLAVIKKQLQDVSDLFTSRYGKESKIAERAIDAVLAATLLEQELLFEQGSGSAETHARSLATTV